MLYRFLGEADNIDTIEVVPTRRAYLLENIAIIRGWTFWHWVFFGGTKSKPSQYLPTAPARKSTGRDSKAKQLLATSNGTNTDKILYSVESLTINNFVLDHYYIPFSFIGITDSGIYIL